jgi:ribosome-associated protein
MTRTYSNSDPAQVRGFAIEAARLIADLKCADVVLLDVTGHSQVCDYVIIGSGTSQRQMKSVADDVAELGDTMGMAAYRSSRDEGTTWVVVDFVEVVVHLFEPDQRLYYDLELMWAQAKRVDWSRTGSAAAAKPGRRSAAAVESDGDDEDESPEPKPSKKVAKKAPARASSTKSAASKATSSKASSSKKTATKRSTGSATGASKKSASRRTPRSADE